jgi:hypothetical protein
MYPNKNEKEEKDTRRCATQEGIETSEICKTQDKNNGLSISHVF